MNVEQLEIIEDVRGKLIAIENLKNIPFEIKRVYFLFGTRSNAERGSHSHISLRQMLIAVSGSCFVTLDDGSQTAKVKLGCPSQSLMVEPGVWHEMSQFSEDCVLLVLASDHYRESDYIRDYNQFLQSKSPND